MPGQSPVARTRTNLERTIDIKGWHDAIHSGILSSETLFVLKCLIIFSGGFDRNNQQLDFSNDKTAKEENLPPITEELELPIVVIRTKENKKSMPGLNSLVNLIMDKFANNLSTTIIYREKDDLEEEDEGRKKKIVDCQLVNGIEDEFIIYCINGGRGYNYSLNAISRARNGFAWIIDTDSG